MYSYVPANAARLAGALAKAGGAKPPGVRRASERERAAGAERGPWGPRERRCKGVRRGEAPR